MSAKLEEEKVYFLDGKLLVKNTFIAKMKNMTLAGVRKWNLQSTEHLADRAKLYDMDLVDEYCGDTAKPPNEDDLELSEISTDEAERRKKINDVRIGDIKIKKELGELIDANDTDKAMAELAVTLKSHLITSEKILPLLLENKTRAEIIKVLTDHNYDILKELSYVFNVEFDCDETLIDIIYAFQTSKKEPLDVVEFLKT